MESLLFEIQNRNSLDHDDHHDLKNLLYQNLFEKSELIQQQQEKLAKIFNSIFFDHQHLNDDNISEPPEPKKFKKINQNQALQFKYSLMDYILELCIERDIILEENFGNFSFQKFLYDLLLNNQSFQPEFIKKLLSKILHSCPSICYNHNDLMMKIFLQILSINESINDLFGKYFEIMSSNNKLIEWYQCYFQLQKHLPNDSYLFDEKFEKIYRIKMFELHPTNSLAIWQSFLSNLTIQNQTTMRLFSLFISHNRMFGQTKRFENLINSTVLLLEKESFQTTKSIAECKCLFQIYYSLASIVVNFFDDHQQKSIEIQTKISTIENLYDMTIIFPQTTVKYWRKCYDNFDNLSDDNDEKIYLIRLLLLNYRLIKQHQDNCQNDELFNNLLTQQILISKQLLIPDIFNFLFQELKNNNQDLQSILEFLFDSFIATSNQRQAIIIVVEIFSHQPNWENKCFQNIFITLWLKKIQYFLPRLFANNYSSLMKEKYWLKYGCDIPDPDKHQKLIHSLQTFSEPFFQIDRSMISADDEDYDSKMIDKNSEKQIEKLFEMFLQSVPIEYISPFNQIRLCIISWAIHSEFLHHQNNSSNQFSTIFIRLNLRLWYSVRKIWFFDFISPSHYIYKLLSHLPDYFNNDCPKLFDRFITIMFQSNNMERLFESLKELINFLECHDNNLDTDSISGYVFMIETILLRNIRQFRRKIQQRKNHFEYECQLSFVHKQLIDLMYKMINEFFKQTKFEIQQRNDLIFIIEAIIELLEEKLFEKIDDSGLNFKKKWQKLFNKFLDLFDGDGDGENLVNNNQQCLINFIKFIAHNRSKLEHLLPKDFLAKRWKEILHTNLIESNDCVEFKQHINSKSGWKKLFKSEEQFQNFKIISDKMFQTDEKMMKKFDNCDQHIDTIDLLLNPILESIIDSNEWQNYLNECLILFREHYTDLSQAKFYIHILTKMVQETTMDSKQKTQILNENFSDLIEIMLLITFLVNNKLMITTIDNIDCLQQLKLKILQFSHHSLERFIRFDLITNQHLFLIYNLCIEMNIFAYCSSNGSIGLYCDLFDRIQMIIQLILSKRPYLAFESMCTGRTILRTNIASLIRITSDRKQFGNATDTDKIRLEQCSKSIQQSVNRLIQFLEFQPYVQSMIIDYLELLLHNTPIDLRIKENLQQSIYQLIDYLIKQNNGKKNLENLYSRLNEKSKELFRKLLDYHDHYYRFKGYV